MWPDFPGFLSDATRVAPRGMPQPMIGPARMGAVNLRPPGSVQQIYNATADFVPGASELRALKDAWRNPSMSTLGGLALAGVPFARPAKKVAKAAPQLHSYMRDFPATDAVAEARKALKRSTSELKYTMPSGNEFTVRPGAAAPELHADMMADIPAAAGRETIQSAAIRMKDGRMFTGRDHFSAIENSGLQPDALVDASDGFVTSSGRFVDREEAYRIHTGEAPAGWPVGLWSEEVRFPGAVSRPGKKDPLSEAKTMLQAGDERLARTEGLHFLGPVLQRLNRDK